MTDIIGRSPVGKKYKHRKIINGKGVYQLKKYADTDTIDLYPDDIILETAGVDANSVWILQKKQVRD